MTAPGFAFLPRKLGKATSRFTSSSANVASSSKLKLPSLVETTKQVSGEEDPEHLLVYQSNDKLKQRERYLEDSAYADLLELALSDYALWANPEMLERLDEDADGYVPLSFVTHTASAFAGLVPTPPESILMRCIKTSVVLEGRIIVAEPNQGTWFGRNGGGGFEVRRRDWTKVRERIRKYTCFQWDSKTVYVENLPHYARTVPTVCHFIRGLLADEQETDASQRSMLQNITFPPHRDDKLGAPHSAKSKGFAFVVLSQTKDAEYLLKRWPWNLDLLPSKARKGESGAVGDAFDFGFHCLSKKNWDKLKEEYLSLQHQLLEKTMAPSRPGPSSLRAPAKSIDAPIDAQRRVRPDHVPVTASTLRQVPLPYPADCLLFIKNVHPETNKTTLRSLFASAFGGASSGDTIDYVDYNKGLDSCYLRLTAAQHTRALVSHFSKHNIAQAQALDGEGSPPTRGPPIEVQLVQGKKEEVYWEKVPEKVRRLAIARAQGQEENVETQEDMGDPGRRKNKRQKRG